MVKLMCVNPLVVRHELSKHITITGAEILNKKGGLTFMGCNCVHVSIPARGVWRHASPGNFLHIRSSEVQSDVFQEEQQCC